MPGQNTLFYGGGVLGVQSQAEQVLRDVRIAPVWEGTTGIQALDLLARKVMLQKLKPLNAHVAEHYSYCAATSTKKFDFGHFWRISELQLYPRPRTRVVCSAYRPCVCRMLIGARNPMLCPIRIVRLRAA